jgi:protein O-mannose beta-1,4-N-acetylglucosaminyltransferase
MGDGGGGGKTGHHHHNHDTAKLLKAVSRTIEPRNFGIGLVAGFLLVTCAYFSTAKFDAIHIALSMEPSSLPPSSQLHFLLPPSFFQL